MAVKIRGDSSERQRNPTIFTDLQNNVGFHCRSTQTCAG